ncbi:IS1380 family transposase [Saccharopolyspora pogona]|uniref:IS1380 family transposase n=1 Tax=Saccharopolyspora pogona TaxID=333966 RepID=UPI0037C590D4
MRSSHSAARVSAVFDDANLVASAGLVPVMRLAERVGLSELVAEGVRVPGSEGANADAKVGSIVAGMLTGADSIDDLDVIRHGAMPKLFGGIRAPSTVGTFLRALTWGHARQVESAARECLVGMARQTPVLAGAAERTFIDADSTLGRVFGHAKQGAAFGHTKIGGHNVRLRGYHPLLTTLSTPRSAPVVAATRMRGGNAGSARGAASLVTETINLARRCGAGPGRMLFRGDSAFYVGEVVSACRAQGVEVSITVAQYPNVQRAIAGIAEDAWTAIKYPQAVWDEASQSWVSDAEIAETEFTAFASDKAHRVAGRLIVRRVKDKNHADALFPVWRYHACFTTSSQPLVEAEKTHRAHAIIEHVNDDLKHGPLAHIPSGVFSANAAWLTLAALTHNLLRAAGSLTSAFHAKARAATLRRTLINIPARVARRARSITLHLPENWPRQHDWHHLFHTTHAPPETA